MLMDAVRGGGCCTMTHTHVEQVDVVITSGRASERQHRVLRVHHYITTVIAHCSTTGRARNPHQSAPLVAAIRRRPPQPIAAPCHAACPRAPRLCVQPPYHPQAQHGRALCSRWYPARVWYVRGCTAAFVCSVDACLFLCLFVVVWRDTCTYCRLHRVCSRTPPAMATACKHAWHTTQGRRCQGSCPSNAE